MNNAFNKLMRNKRIKKSVLGYVRVLEYPPQKDNNEYIHPHFHCLFVVPSKYFDTRLNLYIKQSEWVELWQKVLNVNYIPQVDVRVIKAKNGGDPIAKAVAETIDIPRTTLIRNMALVGLDEAEILNRLGALKGAKKLLDFKERFFNPEKFRDLNLETT